MVIGRTNTQEEGQVGERDKQPARAIKSQLFPELGPATLTY